MFLHSVGLKGLCTPSPKFSSEILACKKINTTSCSCLHTASEAFVRPKNNLDFWKIYFLRFRICGNHFDRKGWRIRKKMEKCIRKFRTQCARTFTVRTVFNLNIIMYRTKHSKPGNHNFTSECWSWNPIFCQYKPTSVQYLWLVINLVCRLLKLPDFSDDVGDL